MTSIKKVISENLRKLMEHNGLSACELGLVSGITQRTISTILDYENHEYVPTVNTLYTLSKYFDIPVYYFLVEDMTPDMMANKDFNELIACYLQAPVGVQKKGFARL